MPIYVIPSPTSTVELSPERDGTVSTSNTSTTPLSGSATFTGTGEQNDYAQVGVSLKTDAAGTLYFDFSNDGTNWDSTFPVNGFKVTADVHEFHTAVKLGRYFRVRLVNGSSAQSYLRLYTYYGDDYVPGSTPLNQSIALDSDAVTTRPSDFQDEVRIARRPGVTGWTKFGYNEDVDTGSAEDRDWET